MAKYMRARGRAPQGNGSQGTKHRRQLLVESLEARQMMAADSVMTWVERLNLVVQADTTLGGPTKASRSYAMVQVAVYDAVNAIEQTHTPFALTEKAAAGADVDAAVAAAARTVMVDLYPAQQATIDAWYAADLAAIPDGQSEDDGVAIGELSGSLCIEMRDSDKSTATKLYRVNKAVGHWRPDPTILSSPQMALDPAWGGVTPFAINSATQFPVPPPPKLNSAAYAAALNEVKDLGALNNSSRTADQEEIGIFWAYDRPGFGPPLVLYNESLIEIATTKGNTIAENARLFALANIAMADAGVAIWHYKYVYDVWRPISGIREAAKDNNPATTADPAWVPLGAPGNGTTIPDFTPPFPSYGSGHAGFGAALFKTLELFYGSDSYNYTLHSDEGGGIDRNYTSFSQAADENGRSRIYLGVHWEFDNVASQTQGRQIGEFIYDRFFQPVSNAVTNQATVVSIRKNGGGMQTYSLADDANVLIRRLGSNVQVVNQGTNSVVFQWPLAQIEHIVVDGRNGAVNNVTIDVNNPLTVPFTVDVEGGVGDGDTLTVVGSARAELLRLDGDELRLAAVGPIVYLPGVEAVTLGGRAGNDSFQISGDQTGRSIVLQGDAGNDTYKISSTSADLTITDSAGVDFLDFTAATSAVDVNLALNAGQMQNDVGGNTLKITGLLDNLDGSAFDDHLMGNTLGNRLRGFAGNDIMRGDSGNDTLEGGEGDDVMLGAVGNDRLLGGNGRDLLIGNAGQDQLYGQGGEDILIGGHTTHDANEAALLDLMAEWTSVNSNSDRVNNLKNGTGVAAGSNGTTYLDSSTLLNDSAIDTLYINTGDFILKFNPDLQRQG